MHTLEPGQALATLQFTLPFLHREHETTKKIIAAIPEAKAAYRPDPIAKTAFDLAAHIAGAENMFLSAVGSTGFDYSVSKRPESVETIADVGRWCSETFAKNYERLSKASGESLAQVIDFRGHLQMPSVFFLQLAIAHTAHHRGQLTVYLRPMGAKVPSIYGESYDDAQARLAAQSA
ncbi:MAG TPA: DinB family protein [Bryobacteraceae bacterium]|nr:DinB family protein [Bryobacteraceae bacterium]